jgi:Biotin-lipoyl like
MNALSDTRPATPPGTQALPRRRAWRLLRWPLLLFALVAALLVGNWWLLVGRWLEGTDNAYVQGDIAVLGARIEGHVAAIRVRDNQRVAAGEPLIELDSALWRARLMERRRASPGPPRQSPPTASRSCSSGRRSRWTRRSSNRRGPSRCGLPPMRAAPGSWSGRAGPVARPLIARHPRSARPMPASAQLSAAR